MIHNGIRQKQPINNIRIHIHVNLPNTHKIRDRHQTRNIRISNGSNNRINRCNIQCKKSKQNSCSW